MLVVLFEPEIPPNTGNVARLCAAFGVELHLIEPLGFKLEDKYLKRAGLDYWPHVKLSVWTDFKSFLARQDRPADERLVMTSAKGVDTTPLRYFNFQNNDALIFGPETRGLPVEILAQSPWHTRIPTRAMDNGGVRSLNLATAAGIVLYQALNSSGQLVDWPPTH